MNDDEKPKSEEPRLELPWALVFNINIIMPLDSSQEMQDAIKREFRLAAEKVKARYETEDLHLALTHRLETPELEIF